MAPAVSNNPAIIGKKMMARKGESPAGRAVNRPNLKNCSYANARSRPKTAKIGRSDPPTIFITCKVASPTAPIATTPNPMRFGAKLRAAIANNPVSKPVNNAPLTMANEEIGRRGALAPTGGAGVLAAGVLATGDGVGGATTGAGGGALATCAGGVTAGGATGGATAGGGGATIGGMVGGD